MKRSSPAACGLDLLTYYKQLRNQRHKRLADKEMRCCRMSETIEGHYLWYMPRSAGRFSSPSKKDEKTPEGGIAI
jgi:hypothetical protein